ncbi:MAG TPA: peptidase MA family metallohydrolase [Polyangiaceae bacterium]|nr:peptidase MA family metallohydrolase [Polyangiaceae bacterium]
MPRFADRLNRLRAADLGPASWRWLKRLRFLSLALVLGLLTALAVVSLGAPRHGSRSAHAVAGEASAHPGDAPHVAGELLRPNAPAGFAQQDAGFIEFAYPPETRERIQPLIEQAPAIRRELSVRFGREVLGSVRVHIARTPGEMATLAPVGAPYPSYASGVAYPQIGFVLLTIFPDQPSAEHDLLEVFKHELAHVALYDALGGQRVPRWLNEGFAVHLSGESSLRRVQVLWSAVLAGEVLPFAQLDRGFASGAGQVNLAYAEAADVVRYLLRTRDANRFNLMLNRLREGASFDHALQESYGVDLVGLEYEWREDASRRYSFWPVLLSGSMVWVGVLGLFVLAWRRHKRRTQATLERWAREEAQEELLRHAQSRLHIVIAPPGEKQPLPPHRVVENVEVPKVQHDGNWHTLH